MWGNAQREGFIPDTNPSNPRLEGLFLEKTSADLYKCSYVKDKDMHKSIEPIIM